MHIIDNKFLFITIFYVEDSNPKFSNQHILYQKLNLLNLFLVIKIGYKTVKNKSRINKTIARH